MQLTWGSLPAGSVTVSAAGGSSPVRLTIEHAGGPGAVDLSGLEAATSYEITVAVNGSTTSCSVRTLAAPPGAELFRFATISDMHLGSDHFGVTKRMVDTSSHLEPFALRSADDAIRSAIGWGARHLIIKGDAAHHGRPADFQLLGQLVDRHPSMPMSLLPGNHDTDVREISIPETVGERQLPYETHVSHLDVPGLRIVVGNTTITGQGPGTLRSVGDDLLSAASEAPDAGAFVAVHQQLQTNDPNRYWPPGISSSESHPFLDRLDQVRPGAVVTSGHTHRNRSRMHRSVLVTEVAATHHWPGVWAGYVIYEGGIRQTVRRIVGPDVIDWHEYSRNAVGSIWGRYASGRLSQRCLVHTWPRA